MPFEFVKSGCYKLPFASKSSLIFTAPADRFDFQQNIIKTGGVNVSLQKRHDIEIFIFTWPDLNIRRAPYLFLIFSFLRNKIMLLTSHVSLAIDSTPNPIEFAPNLLPKGLNRYAALTILSKQS